jgi:inner membrane protein
MPTILSHAIAAAAVGHAYPGRHLPTRFWVWTAVCSMLPDADVIGFAYGIRYADMLGHRGLSHSFFFAAIVGAIVAALYGDLRRRLWLCAYFAAITASHALLDALTDGGLGVALFAPFSNERYFFPWRPIEVSPIGARFFSRRGVSVLMSELQWIWIPSAALVAVTSASRLRRSAEARPRSNARAGGWRGSDG